MKPVFVRDLPGHVNANITTAFLVRSKEVRFKKTGEPYLSLVLGDRTGEVEARMWENVETAPAFERDDFLKVKGLVQVFRNKPQLSIHKLRRMEDREIEMGDFLPRTERDVEEMFAEVRTAAAAVGHPHLRALLGAVLDDPEIAARLKQAPAAKTLHHAYIGGLLEHITSLCGLCRAAAAHYPALDLDLLIAAAILHDLGKVRELEYARSIAYTTEGQLLGHIVIALEMVRDKLSALPDFPPPLRVLVEHLIVSHHGELEFGSPRQPMFPEALVFHFLDNLDSKLNSVLRQLHTDPLVEGAWTGRNAALGRPMLRRERYAAGGAGGDGQPAGAPPAEPAASEPDSALPPAAPSSAPASASARTLFDGPLFGGGETSGGGGDAT